MSDPTRVTVAVAPTPTVVCSLDAGGGGVYEKATIQIDNLDGAQTFVGTVERRSSVLSLWSASTIGDFSAIGPGESVVADLDISGTGYLRVTGTMSGAGGNVAVCLRAE